DGSSATSANAATDATSNASTYVGVLCELKCFLLLLFTYLIFFFKISNTPHRISPIICLINNGITRCKCLLHTSRHNTSLIPAHKFCLIRDCPCLLEILLPLFRVPQRPPYHTLF